MKNGKKPQTALQRYAQKQNKNSKYFKLFVYILSAIAGIVLVVWGITAIIGHFQHQEKARVSACYQVVQELPHESYSQALADVKADVGGVKTASFVYNYHLKNPNKAYPVKQSDPEYFLDNQNRYLRIDFYRMNTKKHLYISLIYDPHKNKLVQADLVPNPEYSVYSQRQKMLKAIKQQDNSGHYSSGKILKMNQKLNQVTAKASM